MKMKIFLFFLLQILAPTFTTANNVTVNSTEQLQTNLNNASPGDFIILDPANYTGQFVAWKNGTAESPITVVSFDKKAKLEGTGENGTVGFTVNGSYWNLKYIPISNYDVGVLLVNGTGNVLESLAIQNGSTGIRIESGGNTLKNCAITQVTVVGIEVVNQANNTVLTSNAVQNAKLSINIADGTCCGNLSYNAALGEVDVRGSNYTFDGNVFTGLMNVTGCMNTFKEEVDKNPSFTNNCTNSQLDGNVFY